MIIDPQATTTVSYDGQYFIAGDAGNDLLAFATHAGNTTFKVSSGNPDSHGNYY